MIDFVRARMMRALRGGCVAGIVGVVVAVPTSADGAITHGASTRDAFNTYGDSYRRVDLPPVGAGSFSSVADALPDGRLLSATGNGIFIETGVATGVFELVASVDSGVFGGAPDPAFLRVSPDGSRIALGGGFGKPLAVFDTAEIGSAGSPTLIDASNADAFSVNHFDAEWMDNSNLGIAGGNFGDPAFVSLLDITSDTMAPINPIIIENINGASGGITFDSAGRLITGNGFGNGGPGSDTGWVKAFDPSDWSIGSPADFESDGIFIGDMLSASSLSMDGEGNLFVGGGDFSEGETGYMGVLSATALSNALLGFGPIDINDAAQFSRLDPLGTGFGFFGSSFNDVTNELYVTDGATWWATVPSPGPAGALVISVFHVLRRRSRDE